MRKLMVLALFCLPALAQVQVTANGGTLSTNREHVVHATIQLGNINGVAVSAGNAVIDLPALESGTMQEGGCLATGGMLSIKASSPGLFQYVGKFTGPNTKICPESSGGTWGPADGVWVDGGYYLLAFSVTDAWGLTGNCVLTTDSLDVAWTGSAPLNFLSCQIQ
jgi:hypothetical protein